MVCRFNYHPTKYTLSIALEVQTTHTPKNNSFFYFPKISKPTKTMHLQWACISPNYSQRLWFWERNNFPLIVKGPYRETIRGVIYLEQTILPILIQGWSIRQSIQKSTPMYLFPAKQVSSEHSPPTFFIQDDRQHLLQRGILVNYRIE